MHVFCSISGEMETGIPVLRHRLLDQKCLVVDQSGIGDLDRDAHSSLEAQEAWNVIAFFFSCCIRFLAAFGSLGPWA